MGNPRQPLTFDTIYHVYNHAVGEDRFFREEKNYYFFMQKVCKWILPISDILSYCLIPNHFHFCLKIKSQIEIKEILHQKLSRKMGMNSKWKLESDALERLIIEQFSNCFNSNAHAYNKSYNRVGSLFKESFQRKEILNDEYLKDLICYIHNNPVKHRMVKHPSHWKHSSFNDLFVCEPTILKRSEVINVFDSVENLLALHKLPLIHTGRHPTVKLRDNTQAFSDNQRL